MLNLVMTLVKMVPILVFYWFLSDPTVTILVSIVYLHIISVSELQGGLQGLEDQLDALKLQMSGGGPASKRRAQFAKAKSSFLSRQKLEKREPEEREQEEDIYEREMIFGDTPAPEFPFEVMDTGSTIQQEVYPNWRAAHPIENDSFRGSCLLKVRTDPVDADPVFQPYFEGRRRLMELQFQGKFKEVPRGTLMMGLEVPTPGLSLGIVGRSMASVILTLLKKMVPDSHYSMGSKNECPHLTFPIVSAMDTFIVTPDGETPPQLGVPSLPPSTNERAEFLNGTRSFESGPTYSMSFHSMYLSLPTWKCAKLPGLKDVALSSFWGDRPLRFVAYDIDDPKGPHLVDEKRYYFKFEIKYHGGPVLFPEEETRPPPQRPLLPGAVKKDERGAEKTEKTKKRKMEKSEPGEGSPNGSGRPGLPPLLSVTPRSQKRALKIRSNSPEVIPPDIITDLQFPAMVRCGGQYMFIIQVTTSQPKTEALNIFSVVRTPEDIRRFARFTKSRRMKVFNKYLKKKSAKYSDKKRSYLCNRMRVMAGLVSEQKSLEIDGGESSSDDDSSDSSSTVEALGRAASPDPSKNAFETENGGGNRSLADCLRLFVEENQTDTFLFSLLSWAKNGFEVGASGSSPGSSKDKSIGRSGDSLICSGLVALATSETNWMMNWATLTSECLQCYEQSSRRTPKYVIRVFDIMRVASLGAQNGGQGDCGDTALPFRGYYFFRIETPVNVSYFFVKTAEERDHWTTSLQSVIPQKHNPAPSLVLMDRTPCSVEVEEEADDPDETLPPKIYDTVPQPGEVSLQSFQSAPAVSATKKKSKSSKSGRKLYYRKVGKRKVMNGKRLYFTPTETQEVPDPLGLSENLLSQVMALTPHSTTQQFALFADRTNFLKSVQLASLSVLDRTAFFLNVFHTLLLHALLVLGPPSADLRHWNSFFQKISYECTGHILSLAEIEHNILRAKGSKPKLLFSFIPKWSQSDPRRVLGLAEVDPRVNILLNYGSTTCPPFIVKFSPGTVDQQMDEAVSRTLDFQVIVDAKRHQISLPKMAYWYQNDYGSSVGDVLRWVHTHASPELQAQLLEIDKSGRFKTAHIVVKFRKYRYNFRKCFEKLEMEEGDGYSSEEDSLLDDESGRKNKVEEDIERAVVQEIGAPVPEKQL